MSTKRIVILGTDNAEPTLAVCNYLIERFSDCITVYERRESRREFLRRRIRKLGLLTVVGQVAFQTIVALLL
jgi:hypothetical protein